VDIITPGAIMGFVGRPLRFKSPEELYDKFQAYKQWAKFNPWNKIEAIKTGDRAGELIYLPIERPLTEWGFAVFCEMSRRGLIEYSTRKQYSYTYARIKDEMSDQRISGGMAGVYEARLVARIDGIKEPKDSFDDDDSSPMPIKINIQVEDGRRNQSEPTAGNIPADAGKV
jgi:hypothetical protein